MKFQRLREHNDKLTAMTGVYEREQVIRDLMKEAGETGTRILAGMFLVGRLSGLQEGLTTGIKEAFIAKDLGMDGRQSLEDIARVAMDRAEVGKNDYDLADIHAIFRSYLEDSGRKDADKRRIINRVLFEMAAVKEDVPFLLQILCGKVNNGIDDKIIIHALLHGNGREKVTRAYAFNPNLEQWIWASDNPDDPDAQDLLWGRAVPGIPLKPQLCARVDDLAKVLIEHQGITIVQPKLDGQRIQVHLSRQWDHGLMMRTVKFFSRTLKDITGDYPELARLFGDLKFRQQAILDGELVALTADGEVAPFEVLQKRLGRKVDRDIVQVAIVFYDVLLWDDAPIAALEYEDRLGFLTKFIPGLSPRLRVIKADYVASVVVLQERLQQAYEAGEEGLVCKDPKGFPSPGARDKRWVKLKPDYMAKGEFGDTYDLVVIGYNKGRGRRHGKIGALWVALRDGDGFVPVCKVGTGLKDPDLDWFMANLVPMQGDVHTDLAYREMEMDVLVEPNIVIEVGATGGQTKIDKWAGISLRFPYFIQAREDKTAVQATSVSEITVVNLQGSRRIP